MPKYQPTYSPEELQTEEWRPVVGWEGIYIVSDLGRVMRVKPSPYAKAGHVMAHCLDDKGYPLVQLTRPKEKRTVHAHLLVARAFLGPPPEGHQVNHKDCDQKNARLSNLEYVTPLENIRHAVANGRFVRGKAHHFSWREDLILRGENAYAAKLKDADIPRIRELHRQGYTLVALGKMYGVTHQTIRYITIRKTWAHIP